MCITADVFLKTTISFLFCLTWAIGSSETVAKVMQMFGLGKCMRQILSVFILFKKFFVYLSHYIVQFPFHLHQFFAYGP